MKETGMDLLLSNEDNKYAKKYDGDSTTFLFLNIVFLAIFDGILVFMLFDIEKKHGINWQKIKENLYNILNKDKLVKTAQIINSQYADYDILFLQEVRNNLLDDLESNDALKQIAQNYDIIFPEKVSKNNQTSIICLRKGTFSSAEVKEVSDEYFEVYDGKTAIGNGDLFVICVSEYLLISFHGDSGGMASGDLMKAIDELQRGKYKDKKLICGIDANTHCDAVSDGKKKYAVGAFDALLKELGFCTCFDGKPTKHTVNSARTYLQPQLNKAVKKKKLLEDDVDFRAPKDYICYLENQFGVKKGSTNVDNQGNGGYNASFEYVIPSESFPSDHAIISAELVLK